MTQMQTLDLQSAEETEIRKPSALDGRQKIVSQRAVEI
jgi:hypothetical protein